ncbi:MAG: helix-turn-helix domain-containing protein [Hyphomicrobiaceae bacterium]
MANNRSGERKRPQRSLLGLRVEAYMDARGCQQKRLAEAIGVDAADLSDMLAGRRAFGVEKLKRAVDFLGNCTLPDLLDENVLVRWPGVQQRFLDAFSRQTDDWVAVAPHEWQLYANEESFLRSIDCINTSLTEIRSFTLSMDFIGITNFLAALATFLERAYNKRLDGADQLLFDASDQMVHCLSHALPPRSLKRSADPFLSKMRRLYEDSDDPLLGARLWAREADVLKIYGEVDSTAFKYASDLLWRARDALGQHEHSRIGYHSIRSLVVVTARTKGAAELLNVLGLAERALDGNWLTVEEKRHVLDGMGEACAFHFSKTGDIRYCRQALQYYDRAGAVPLPGRPTEIIFRLRKLPFVYARYGILDRMSRDGAEIEGFRRDLRLGRSSRVEQQMKALHIELVQKGLLKE